MIVSNFIKLLIRILFLFLIKHLITTLDVEMHHDFKIEIKDVYDLSYAFLSLLIICEVISIFVSLFSFLQVNFKIKLILLFTIPIVFSVLNYFIQYTFKYHEGINDSYDIAIMRTDLEAQLIVWNTVVSLNLTVLFFKLMLSVFKPFSTETKIKTPTIFLFWMYTLVFVIVALIKFIMSNAQFQFQGIVWTMYVWEINGLCYLVIGLFLIDVFFFKKLKSKQIISLLSIITLIIVSIVYFFPQLKTINERRANDFSNHLSLFKNLSIDILILFSVISLLVFGIRFLIQKYTKKKILSS